MPALSPTMEKGNLAKWLKKEGDKVKSGDVLAEIETDKATMEVEAVDEGVLAKILVPEGTADVPVNNVIAVIAGEGEDAKSITGPAQIRRACGCRRARAEAASRPRRPPMACRRSKLDRRRPAAFRDAARAPSRQGWRHRSREDRRQRSERPHRRTRCEGGAGFRAKAAAGASARHPAAVDERCGDQSGFRAASYREVPHDAMRRTIARRLTEAQTIPQFYLTVDCEIDALLKLREDINKAAPKAKDGTPAFKVSVNDMVVKALALALVSVPGANVTYTESAMLHHEHADVAVAVALPEGLITPIVRSADLLPLSALSTMMKDYVARAKERRLKPQEYEGGVSAISNLGMYGIKNFTAVLNPPQSSIIAIGMGEERAVVKNGAIAVATIHERDHHLRSSRARRRERRGAHRRVQALDRKSGGDAGVSLVDA